MKKLFSALIILFFLSTGSGYSQTTPVDGLRHKTPNVLAFTNATVIISPGKQIENATLIIRDKRIESVGKAQKIPNDAHIIDMKGMFIYPGFIESFSDYGLPVPKKPKEGNQRVTKPKVRKGTLHWNPAVQPERDAAKLFQPNPEAAKKLRSLGFTVTNSAVLDGIFRGESVVTTLGEGLPNDLILKKQSAQFLSFSKGTSTELYPGSLMGSIAFIRQTFFDTQWYKQAISAYTLNSTQNRPELNDALASLEKVISGKENIVFEVSDHLNLLRAAKIVKEFNLNAVFKGSGYEYRILDEVKKLRSTLIIPVNFPSTPDVSTVDKEYDVTLANLKHWDTAPENPARLEKKGITFAFTANGLEDIKVFHKNIKTAVKRGLSKKTALNALTVIPAAICGISDITGTLEKNKLANLIVCNKDIFEDDAKIYSVWIEGKKHEVQPKPEVEPRGDWKVSLKNGGDLPQELDLNISGKLDKLKGKITKDTIKVDLSKINVAGTKLNLTFKGDKLNLPGTIRMSGRISQDKVLGIGDLGSTVSFTWNGNRTKLFVAEKDTTKPEEIKMASFATVCPDQAFGRASLPPQPAVLFVKNATIWTSSTNGILQNADMLIHKGKIEKIGLSLKVPKNAVVVDAKDKHITPGIIDAHSHIASSGGLNEWSQAISAETSAGDVINNQDIKIYRQLAGGTTAALVLHGSANPIGGLSEVIKLRWGASPEQLKLKGNKSIIKFALGENVKQSGWSSSTRYPQTRMGVEQIIFDEFQAAHEYEQEWKKYNKLSKSKKKSTVPPRRDIELDAMVDVLNAKTMIHCHSYVHGEILMMIRLAEKFGITVGTFIHVLEGYKVASEMKEHGAMATTFADWWSYKVEAFDAIPYNAAVMHEQGVITTINSDDGELGRRLNQDAAKAVKYGGVSETDALNFVTINSAIQLYVDDRIGSLEAGKDADFVIWDGKPLSGYSKVLQTWVDGRKYFDIDEDKQMQKEVKEQRAALIQKILKEKKKPSNKKH